MWLIEWVVEWIVPICLVSVLLFLVFLKVVERACRPKKLPTLEDFILYVTDKEVKKVRLTWQYDYPAFPPGESAPLRKINCKHTVVYEAPYSLLRRIAYETVLGEAEITFGTQSAEAELARLREHFRSKVQGLVQDLTKRVPWCEIETSNVANLEPHL